MIVIWRRKVYSYALKWRTSQGCWRLGELTEEPKGRRWIYAAFWISACGVSPSDSCGFCVMPLSLCVAVSFPAPSAVASRPGPSLPPSGFLPSGEGKNQDSVPQCCVSCLYCSLRPHAFSPAGQLIAQALLTACCLLSVPPLVTVSSLPPDFHPSMWEQVSLRPVPE